MTKHTAGGARDWWQPRVSVRAGGSGGKTRNHWTSTGYHDTG
jgi:hypothetical protein